MKKLLAALLFLPTLALAGAVTVTQGQLQGDLVEGVHSFKGIPFAAPPVGDLRWAATRPAAPWEGLRDARQFGSDCMQMPYAPQTPYYRELIHPSEDCLYLNVWSTSLVAQRKAPVMVWIHGGAHTRGSGATAAYDGVPFARQGVVLVTVNYRLNVFGFMPHAELSAEQGGHSGNYGLYDQVAALQWVHDNIEQFGGDPANVTIFGESAGSSSVNQLVVNPHAKGLFHRAIGQSGGIFRPMVELEGGADSGHARGATVAKALQVTSLKAMRQVDADTLLATYAELAAKGYRSGVIVDGRAIPGQAIDLFRQGAYNQVPALVGYNQDEASVFALSPAMGIAQDREGFSNSLAQLAPEYQQAFLAAYPEQAAPNARQPQLDFWRDMVFGWNMHTWARLNEEDGNPAWLYYFTRQPPNLVGQMLGAFHASEIVYVFGNGVSMTEEDQTLSQQMQRYWVNFATTGNPNGNGQQSWPRYGSEGHYLELKPGPEAGKALNRTAMAVWDKAGGL